MAICTHASSPTWERLRECPRCIGHRPYLYRTLATALFVGTVLFIINHLDVVVAGQASAEVWIKTGLTFLVPFCTSNLGLLAACQRRPARRVHSQPVAPSWVRLRECPSCILYRPHLSRTLGTALLVGTILFAINQLNLVIAGEASPEVWIKTALTFLVPFCVANWGVLIGCRRSPPARVVSSKQSST